MNNPGNPGKDGTHMPTKNASMNDQLKSVRAKLDEKQDERNALVTERDSAKDKFASADVPADQMTEHEDFKAAEQAVRGLGETDDAITDLRQAEVSLLEMMGQDSPIRADASDARGVLEPASGWGVEDVLGGESYKQLRNSGLITSKSALGTIDLGQVAERDAAASYFGGGGAGRPLAADVGADQKVGATAADRRGIVEPNLKRLSILDLLPSGETDSDVVQYVQVLTLPEQAAETAPGDLKPEAAFTTLDADAQVRTIAGWLKIRRQSLADIPVLRQMLGVLLPHDVRRRLEAQALAGDGLGDNLLGILNTPGIGAPAFVAGDNVADAILRAMTVVILSDADPNFAALHPLSWQDILLMREDQANRTGAYIYGSPAMAAAPTIWGLATTPNRAVPQATPLVGDSMGASVLYREGVNTRVSDSDGDDFRRNRVTMLAETRAALPVWRPTSFAIAATEPPPPPPV